MSDRAARLELAILLVLLGACATLGFAVIVFVVLWVLGRLTGALS